MVFHRTAKIISTFAFILARHHCQPQFDETSIERMVFTPKFSTDTDPETRVFCVVDRRDNRELYDRLTGHLSYVSQPSQLTLDAIARKLAIK